MHIKGYWALKLGISVLVGFKHMVGFTHFTVVAVVVEVAVAVPHTTLLIARLAARFYKDFCVLGLKLKQGRFSVVINNRM